MSKRRNTRGQMRREEWEAEEEREESGDSGEGFQRASDEAIKKRKILTAKPKAATNGGAKGAAFGAAATAGENPFQGFQGLAGAAATTAPANNPFAGFAGLTGTTTTTTKPVGASNAGFDGSTGLGAARSANKATTYQEAMEELNKEFLQFATEQLKQNPSSKWTAAIQDYLRYAQEIETKFASSKQATPTASLSSGLSATNGNSKSTDSAAPSGFQASAAPSGGLFTSGAASSLTTGGFDLKSSNGDKTDDKSESASETAKSAPSFTSSLFKTPSSDTPATTGAFKFVVPSSTATTTTASSGFSFNLPKSTSSPAPASASSGFSFNLPKTTGSAAPSGSLFGSSAAPSLSFGAPASASASTTAQETKDEDEENVGREDPTVILKSDNPDEECAFETEKAKVFEFKTDEKRWADKGVHPLKVLVNKNTKAARILVRNQYGKIVLNASLFKGMPLQIQETKGKKTGVTTTLQIDGQLVRFLLKVNSASVDAFHDALQTNTPQ